MTKPDLEPNRRILVIDDNQAIHDDFRKILCSDGTTAGLDEDEAALFGGGRDAHATHGLPATDSEGFELDAACQGEEGLALVKKAVQEGRPYAMAFVDMRMPPGWDGIETVARIWRECPDLEVVICTAYSDYSWDEMIEKLGRTDRLLILKKPFDNIEVRQLAHSLTERWNLAHQVHVYRGEPEATEQARGETPIVVVDDDPAALALFTTIIRKAGYDVREHTSGAEAWDSFNSQQPTILISDWRMPGLDGLELCRRIRASDHLGRVYIILVTASDESEDVVAALEAGADDFLSKPCNQRELLARIRAGERVLRLLRQQRESASVIETRNSALEAANKRAGEAIERLQQTQQQLLQADKMASIGNLAAGVAHEINNPIGFISSNLNSLAEYSVGLEKVLKAYDELLGECQEGGAGIGEKAQAARKAREECDLDYIMSDLGNLIGESTEGAQRVRQIVADLRDFSHVDSPDVTEEDINNLLDKTVNVAWNELKYKTEVVKEYGDIPAIPCYGGKLGQVFLNVVINAAHAIEERGTITIRTGSAGDNVWIEVEDTGCGIPPENLSRIFDPFFTTKDVGKGTGMGLNLAYKIIEAHGGQITAQSDVGKGTTFRIELPSNGLPQQDVKELQHETVA